jgi:hypothetical protein
MNRVARCACGSSSVALVGEPKVSCICHCTNCKRRTGGAFGLSAYFLNADLSSSRVNCRSIPSDTQRSSTMRIATSASSAERRSTGVPPIALTWSESLVAALRKKALRQLPLPAPPLRSWSGLSCQTIARSWNVLLERQSPNPSVEWTFQRPLAAPLMPNVRAHD